MRIIRRVVSAARSKSHDLSINNDNNFLLDFNYIIAFILARTLPKLNVAASDHNDYPAAHELAAILSILVFIYVYEI